MRKFIVFGLCAFACVSVYGQPQGYNYNGQSTQLNNKNDFRPSFGIPCSDHTKHHSNDLPVAAALIGQQSNGRIINQHSHTYQDHSEAADGGHIETGQLTAASGISTDTKAVTVNSHIVVGANSEESHDYNHAESLPVSESLISNQQFAYNDDAHTQSFNQNHGYSEQSLQLTPIVPIVPVTQVFHLAPSPQIAQTVIPSHAQLGYDYNQIGSVHGSENIEHSNQIISGPSGHQEISVGPAQSLFQPQGYQYQGNQITTNLFTPNAHTAHVQQGIISNVGTSEQAFELPLAQIGPVPDNSYGPPPPQAELTVPLPTPIIAPHESYGAPSPVVESLSNYDSPPPVHGPFGAQPTYKDNGNLGSIHASHNGGNSNNFGFNGNANSFSGLGAYAGNNHGLINGPRPIQGGGGIRGHNELNRFNGQQSQIFHDNNKYAAPNRQINGRPQFQSNRYQGNNQFQGSNNFQGNNIYQGSGSSQLNQFSGSSSNNQFQSQSNNQLGSLSGNLGNVIRDSFAHTGLDPTVQKHIYVHVPPEDHEDQDNQIRQLPQVAPKKHYKIIFIKAPSSPQPNYAKLAAANNALTEEKTLVYVLVKKPDEPSFEEIQAAQQSVKPSKPEVYFIKYKTRKDEYKNNQNEQQINDFNGSFDGSDLSQSQSPLVDERTAGGSSFNQISSNSADSYSLSEQNSNSQISLEGNAAPVYGPPTIK